MKKILAASVLTFALAAPAFADDITMEPHPFVSSLSRAQVIEELQQFRQAGINPWADDYNQLAHAPSTLSREQVTADFMASRGIVSAYNGEDSGSAYLMHAGARTQPTGTELARAE